MVTRNATKLSTIQNVDPIWTTLRDEAKAMADFEPSLAGFVYSTILNQNSFEAALAHRIAQRMDHGDVPAYMISQAFEQMFADDPEISQIVRTDIQAVLDRDAACDRYIEPFLYFKGFHALQTHRLAHWFWKNDRRDFALFLQSRSSSVFQCDINPNARFGRGIFLDHSTGIVVGETAVVDDDVSILQEVTLGGTGKEDGDRHPKVGKGVLIGAGAKILGNIRIGDCSKVAAGSVVLKDVPQYATVAGVPARVVSVRKGCEPPSRVMDQGIER
ncbi:serine O-acetyltransferase [Fulvimarina endophytica]|uniref:Serine acetyltransferase n=1 Tax=Fulvimarina endophytica TaxID=2293836 RepID=A0A371X0L1_9HYPH|nr:serine O-acetyltransferase [Fulvimarina endophytica]RFC62780.1 serine O-acetyltransferase [Fulvimarina endophytica]